jgi:hypothetical protein
LVKRDHSGVEGKKKTQGRLRCKNFTRERSKNLTRERSKNFTRERS